jgi:hypothetical protein
MQKPFEHTALLGFGLPQALLLEMQQIREAFRTSSFFLEPAPVLTPVALPAPSLRRRPSLERLSGQQ